MVRDDFAKQVAAHRTLALGGVSPLQVPIKEGEASDYETDGGILIVHDTDDPIPAVQRNCLKL